MALTCVSCEKDFEPPPKMLKRWDYKPYCMACRTAVKVVRRGGKTGRNEPCPCGSGQKYKRCCISKPVRPEGVA